MCDSTLLLIKEKIINTDAIIKLLSDKNTQLNHLKRQLKNIYKSYLAKTKELEICNLQTTTYKTLESDYKSLLEKYNKLETVHQDYVNVSTIKYQHICKELEESNSTQSTRIIKKCNKCKEEIAKNRILARKLTLLTQQMDKLTRLASKDEEDDKMLPKKPKNNTDYKELKEKHATEIENLTCEHLLQLDEVGNKFKNEISKYQNIVVSLEAREMNLKDKIDELQLELNNRKVCLAENSNLKMQNQLNQDVSSSLHELLNECGSMEVQAVKNDCLKTMLDQSSQTDEISFYLSDNDKLDVEINHNEDIKCIFGDDIDNLSDYDNVLSNNHEDFLDFNSIEHQDYKNQNGNCNETKFEEYQNKIKEYEDQVVALEGNEMILREKVDELTFELNSIKNKLTLVEKDDKKYLNENDEVAFLGFSHKQNKIECVVNNKTNKSEEKLINKDNVSCDKDLINSKLLDLENTETIDVLKCIQEMKTIPELLSPFSSSENEEETSIDDDSLKKIRLRKRLQSKRIAQEKRRRFINNIQKDLFKSLVRYVGRMLKKSQSKGIHLNSNNKFKKMSKQFKRKRKLEMLRWTALREIHSADSDVSCAASKSKIEMRKLRKYKHWKVNNKEEYAEICNKFNKMTEFYHSLSGNESKSDENVNTIEESCSSGLDSGFGKSDNEINNFIRSQTKNLIENKNSSENENEYSKVSDKINVCKNSQIKNEDTDRINDTIDYNQDNSVKQLKQSETISSANENECNKLNEKVNVFKDAQYKDEDGDKCNDAINCSENNRVNILSVIVLKEPTLKQSENSQIVMKDISQNVSLENQNVVDDTFLNQETVLNDEKCLEKNDFVKDNFKLINESIGTKKNTKATNKPQKLKKRRKTFRNRKKSSGRICCQNDISEIKHEENYLDNSFQNTSDKNEKSETTKPDFIAGELNLLQNSVVETENVNNCTDDHALQGSSYKLQESVEDKFQNDLTHTIDSFENSVLKVQSTNNCEGNNLHTDISDKNSKPETEKQDFSIFSTDHIQKSVIKHNDDNSNITLLQNIVEKKQGIETEISQDSLIENDVSETENEDNYLTDNSSSFQRKKWKRRCLKSEINLENNRRFSARIMNLKLKQSENNTKEVIEHKSAINNVKLTNSILDLIPTLEKPSKDIFKSTPQTKRKNDLFGECSSSESDNDSQSDTKLLIINPVEGNAAETSQKHDFQNSKPQSSLKQIPCTLEEGDVPVKPTKTRKAYDAKKDPIVNKLKRKHNESDKVKDLNACKSLKKLKKVEDDFEENLRNIENVKDIINVESERKLERTSFKRPVKRKLDTPMSPPHSVEDEYVAPKIIPLEPIGDLCEGAGKKLLKKLVQFPSESVILQEVLEKFSSQKEEYIIRLIIEEVLTDTSKSDNTYTPPAPIMTPVQRTLLGLLIKLQESFPDILKAMLFSLEYKILTETDVNGLISITRLYTGICKLKKELHRMRRMIGDAFFTLGDLAIPFFFTVLSTWIEILPLETESQDNMFVKVLIQIVNMKNCKPGYCLTTLKGLLQNYYGYPKERWKSEDIFIEVFTKFKENPSKFLEFCLLILFKNHLNKWVYEQIKTHVKPLLDDSSNNHVKEAIVLLVSNTLPQFGSDNSPHVQEVKTWLKDVD